MKELTAKDTINTISNRNDAIISSTSQVKQNIYKQQTTSVHSSNFFSFSGIVDQYFLNSNQTLQNLDYKMDENEGRNFLTDIYPKQHQMTNSQESPPQTPNSFGFNGLPYRLAQVRIRDNLVDKMYNSVKIYLVSDIEDCQKAGLLFKFDGESVDLKINKSQGKLLQKMGKLDHILCQYWDEDYLRWSQVQVSISLLDE